MVVRHHHAAMKKVIIIGLAVIIVTMIAVLWTRSRHPSDRQIQRELAGTWYFTWPKDPRLTTTNVIAPDGSCVSEVSGFPDGKTIRSEGTFIVRDGTVIATVTNGGRQQTMQWHIVRLNIHELVWSNNGVIEPAFHKAGG